MATCEESIMGHEMILSTIYFRVNNIEQQWEEINHNFKKAIEEVKNNYSEGEWFSYMDNCGWSEYCQIDVIEKLEGLRDCLRSNEIGYCHFGKYIQFYTGGMSGGEDPTYSSEYIYLAQDMPEKIKRILRLSYFVDTYQLLLDTHDDSLPQKIKEDLKAWQIARKV